MTAAGTANKLYMLRLSAYDEPTIGIEGISVSINIEGIEISYANVMYLLKEDIFLIN